MAVLFNFDKILFRQVTSLSAMRDDELHEIIFQIIISRMRRDSHCVDTLKTRVIKRLLKSITNVFKSESILLNLHSHLVIVGDIHGNIDSLIHIFQKFKYPPYQSYLFLGDYVDRGQNSIEVLLLLYSLKLLYPNQIYILRGNHESKQATRTYGFKDECMTYLNHHFYSKFCKSFEYMPIAAIVNDAFYCVHGGLSPSLQDLSEIETLIERPIPDISCSIAADLLWSDPNPNSSIVFEKSNRGIGYLYNADAVSQFLEDNKLKCVVRAHEFCEKGYNWMNDDCITIFSSFDYMGKNNEAAIAIVNGTDISIITFSKEVAEMLITKRTLLPEWLLLSGSVMKKPAELIDILSDIGLDAPIVVL